MYEEREKKKMANRGIEILSDVLSQRKMNFGKKRKNLTFKKHMESIYSLLFLIRQDLKIKNQIGCYVTTMDKCIFYNSIYLCC